MKKPVTLITAAALIALTVIGGSASAAESGTNAPTATAPDTSSYSYLQGQQRSAARNDLYAQAALLPEEERDAFLAEHGIGETPWSEEAAASYSYVQGQQRGASFRHSTDTERTQDTSGYSFRTGQQRGASYQP